MSGAGVGDSPTHDTPGRGDHNVELAALCVRFRRGLEGVPKPFGDLGAVAPMSGVLSEKAEKVLLKGPGLLSSKYGGIAVAQGSVACRRIQRGSNCFRGVRGGGVMHT